ncbi:hypothetical protein RRG08_038542 [Elysia crispata]|uniref:Uncharacterized protein n=1 Tax=Elysia crispata TaxID=231223 RepID=A0AAE1B1Q2_9GAST|nr:hypothetical protein RRG08_038542 [Elysia crispata]
MCAWFLRQVREEEDFLRSVWFSDEAHFYLSGTVNSRRKGRSDLRSTGIKKGGRGSYGTDVRVDGAIVKTSEARSELGSTDKWRSYGTDFKGRSDPNTTERWGSYGTDFKRRSDPNTTEKWGFYGIDFKGRSDPNTTERWGFYGIESKLDLA